MTIYYLGRVIKASYLSSLGFHEGVVIMKISNNLFASFANQKINKKPVIQKEPKKVSSNFDKLILNSTSISDEKFIGDVTGKLLQEVRTPNSSVKLENIKSEIEKGVYDIGVDEILKKMMLS